METETYVMLAIRLKYVQECEAQPVLLLITEISKMITAIRAKLAKIHEERLNPCNLFPVTCTLLNIWRKN